jgi:hypothetical protein
MEDVDMTPEELRELLIPSDLETPGQASTTSITMRELCDVLQIDLLFPVTDSDHAVIDYHYL